MRDEKSSLLTRRLASISEKIKSAEHIPTVAAVCSIDPLEIWGGDILNFVLLAGGRNIFGKSPDNAILVSWSQIKNENPEIILVLEPGVGIDEARARMAPLTIQSGWYDLAAVHNNQVFLLNGELLSPSALRTPDAKMADVLEVIAEALHPELFDFGHRHENWQYWGFNRVV